MSSPDFSHMTKGLNVLAQEVPFKFEMLEGSPTIWSLPATEENKPFFNETLRRVNARRSRRSKLTTVDTVKASRDEDKELLAKHCARRWDVLDAAGKEVPFSQENVLGFFNAIPDFIFDDYRTFLTDQSNFIEAAALGER